MISWGLEGSSTSMIRKPGNVPWYAVPPWNAMSEFACDRLPPDGRAENPRNRMLSLFVYVVGESAAKNDGAACASSPSPTVGISPENTPRLVSSGCADAPTGTTSDNATAAAISHFGLMYPSLGSEVAPP